MDDEEYPCYGLKKKKSYQINSLINAMLVVVVRRDLHLGLLYLNSSLFTHELSVGTEAVRWSCELFHPGCVVQEHFSACF